MLGSCIGNLSFNGPFIRYSRLFFAVIEYWHKTPTRKRNETEADLFDTIYANFESTDPRKYTFLKKYMDW